MSALQPWVKVSAFLLGAIAAGAVLGVIVSAAGRGLATATPSPATTSPPHTAVAVATADPTPTASSTPTTATSEPSASPSPASRTSPSPSPQQVAAGLPEGCFSDGFLREGEWTDPIIAEDLLRRLPVPSYWSEPQALVGSSANSLFVSAFAECTGADPATIRWGSVNGGLTSGTFPQAIQVDGYTGPELAQILIDGYLHPEQREALDVGHHAGWTYRYLDATIAITASADTVYWYWVWPCCYEGPLFTEHTFVDVVHQYLDLTNDVPVAWP